MLFFIISLIALRSVAYDVDVPLACTVRLSNGVVPKKLRAPCAARTNLYRNATYAIGLDNSRLDYKVYWDKTAVIWTRTVIHSDMRIYRFPIES